MIRQLYFKLYVQFIVLGRKRHTGVQFEYHIIECMEFHCFISLLDMLLWYGWKAEVVKFAYIVS